MKKSLLLVLILGLALAGITGMGLWSAYRSFLDAPLDIPGERMRLEVEPGASVRGVIAQLQGDKATHYSWRWRLLLRLEPATIQVGEYWLESGITPRGLMSKLERGEVIQYRFTIVEGWNYLQLREALLAEPRLAKRADEWNTGQVMASLGSDASSPEGWFLPETYAYVRGDGALDLLTRAHAAMQETLGGVWTARALDLPLADPYELLILASIVEKEAALPAERADIAGVFVRRLQQGWRLETDPSVIYGLGENFDGNIRRRDLDADTPYNTYTRHGLPPTPIAMPGRSAIEASAWPSIGSAMFFVADGAGGHVFSDTLEQHNQAVQRMLQRTPQGKDQPR